MKRIYEEKVSVSTDEEVMDVERGKVIESMGNLLTAINSYVLLLKSKRNC